MVLVKIVLCGLLVLAIALVASLSCLSLHFWTLLSSATSLMGWGEKTTAGSSSWCWWLAVGQERAGDGAGCGYRDVKEHKGFWDIFPVSVGQEL